METLEKTKKRSKFQKMESSSKIQETLKAGDTLVVKIAALGANNVGVAELKNGYTVVVPNTKVGEKIQVKVEKIFLGKNFSGASGQPIRYVVARPTADSAENTFEKNANTLKFDFQVGQKFQTTITKKGPKNSGLVSLAKNFLLIVPNAKMGQKVIVEIQKIKENYALGKIVDPINGSKETTFSENSAFPGQQYTVMIPYSAKTFRNCFVFKFQGKIVFLKKELGIQADQKVKIQIQKSTENFFFAKVVEIQPRSSEQEKARVKEKVQKMIRSSLHFGKKLFVAMQICENIFGLEKKDRRLKTKEKMQKNLW